MEENKLTAFYCYANATFYLMFLAVFVFFGADANITNAFSKSASSPLYLSYFFVACSWIMLLTAQLLFVLRGLNPSSRKTAHYTNCLNLKIKFHYVLLCALYIAVFISSAALLHNQNATVKIVTDSLILISV